MKNIFKPILFSTPMVQAILGDTKMLTRRTKGLEKINIDSDAWDYDGISMQGNIKTGIDPNIYLVFKNKKTKERINISKTYKSGDILWVRETYLSYKIPRMDHYEVKNHYKTEHSPLMEPFFKANGYKYKPSIHMPKEACRIFLKVVSVKVERLQNITEEDSIAEGAIQHESDTDWLTAKYGFQIIWENINGKESWNENPFVWVIQFEKIEKPLDFIPV